MPDPFVRTAAGSAGSVGRGLGDRLERRQRPPGDRPREPAVHEPPRARAAAARKSCSIGTWQPAARRLDAPGHVHAAGRAGRRGRSAAGATSGSAHVRDRQATGSPSPRSGTSGRRATKSDDERPSAARARRLASARSGAGARPALDVAGQPEHEVGRRVDVDARSWSASVVAHGARSAARKRGSSARPAGTRSPITRPIVARTASRDRRPAGRRTRTAPGAPGTPGPATTRASLARNRRAHRAVVGGEARRSPAAARRRDGRGRRARPRRARGAGPRPVNGSRNPAASPTSSQPGPGPPARPGGRAARRRRPRRAAAPPARRPGRPRWRARTRRSDRATAARPVARQRRPPRRPSTIPTFTRPPGTGRDPDVAVADDEHPRVATARRTVGSRDVVASPSAAGQARGPGHAGRRGHDRAQPVGADDRPRREPVVACRRASRTLEPARRRGRRR